MVERGRWQRPKLEFEARLCSECDEIEDEFHVLLECNRFKNLRKKYLPSYLVAKPSMYKFIHFMNTMDGDNLRLFGILCNKILTFYNEEVI